jgi:hypothetical protein
MNNIAIDDKASKGYIHLDTKKLSPLWPVVGGLLMTLWTLGGSVS